MRAQFFLISIVLILISMFYVYTYIRSEDLSSTLFFERTSVLDMQNIIDSIQMRNSRYATNGLTWWNTSWQYRKRLTFSTTIPVSPEARTFEINPYVPSERLFSSSCTRELRLTNVSVSPVELSSDVSKADLPGCNLTITDTLRCEGANCQATVEYFVYYGYNNPDTPSYRSTSQGTETVFDISPDESITALCKHLQAIYPKMGAQVICNVLGNNINKTNTSLYYSSTNLKFNGTII